MNDKNHLLGGGGKMKKREQAPEKTRWGKTHENRYQKHQNLPGQHENGGVHKSQQVGLPGGKKNK